MTKKNQELLCNCVNEERKNVIEMEINLEKNKLKTPENGFTIIELIVVMVILVIASLVAVPMFSSAADMQLRAASNMRAADLEYAKNLAIARQQNHSVVFDTTSNAYHVEVITETGGDIIPHPITGKLSVSFPTTSSLSQVTIDSTDFDNDTITFNYLGSPFSGSGTGTPLNSGQINLQGGTFTMTVTVEPVTGYVTIQ